MSYLNRPHDRMWDREFTGYGRHHKYFDTPLVPEKSSYSIRVV
jgi:hypothetical protein